ncbi:efflux transporter outer membrane subunit, partial [Thioclava sp. BHET1]
MTKALSLMSLLLVSACAVGPNFQQPAVPLSASFAGGSAGSDGNVANQAWWRSYNDPRLTRYVETGLSQNLDVQGAQERIREAQAELRETGVNEAVTGTVDASRTRGGGTGQSPHYATTATLSPAIVLDLFGGLRRERESATAALVAAQADLQETRLEWLASMIEAYSNARYYQEAIALTRASISSRSETLQITQKQFDNGDATTYDLAEARAVLQTAQADLPQYVALFNSNVYAIANLLNQPGEPILAQMRKGAPQLRIPYTAASGIPADLLRNRPDVRYDEALLHEAVANVGVATADMLPSVSLGGTLSDEAGTRSWSFGPSISLPLLSQGLL